MSVANKDDFEESIDTSEIAELDASFFAKAILVRQGENIIEAVRTARERSGSSRVS